VELRYPITGIAGCCAYAASGHAAAAPPSSLMKSRRLISEFFPPNGAAAGHSTRKRPPSQTLCRIFSCRSRHQPVLGADPNVLADTAGRFMSVRMPGRGLLSGQSWNRLARDGVLIV
jgi:hypothetical protein